MNEKHPKKGAKLEFTKGNREKLVEIGRPWRFGPDWPGRRCLAKTRSGGHCQCVAMTGKSRCRIHGGLSSGPRTLVGQENSRKAVLKHGHFSKAAMEKRQGIVKGIADIETWARAQGYNLDV